MRGHSSGQPSSKGFRHTSLSQPHEITFRTVHHSDCACESNWHIQVHPCCYSCGHPPSNMSASLAIVHVPATTQVLRSHFDNQLKLMCWTNVTHYPCKQLLKESHVYVNLDWAPWYELAHKPLVTAEWAECRKENCKRVEKSVCTGTSADKVCTCMHAAGSMSA